MMASGGNTTAILSTEHLLEQGTVVRLIPKHYADRRNSSTAERRGCREVCVDAAVSPRVLPGEARSCEGANRLDSWWLVQLPLHRHTQRFDSNLRRYERIPRSPNVAQ